MSAGVYRRKYICTTPQIERNGVERKWIALYTLEQYTNFADLMEKKKYFYSLYTVAQ